ncbi:hypothetical protein BE08_04940 [Sorangium cellulosum]|uniref:Uncharacterized protein n=1 Tax=Sorangium cellulosum TaxID=56 RepID=A0A150PL35_SORCE|nr:hypothetical protein BE08_04940 [Sorangium cellulosum]
MFALGVLLSTSSCAQVLGLDEFEDCDADSCSGVVWAKSFGSHEFLFPESARFDSNGNILLSGFFRGTTDFGGQPLISSHNDFFLAKLKPDGSHAVSRLLLVEGADGAMGSRLSVLPDDSVVLSGSYERAIDFGSGDPINAPAPDEDAAFVARFSPDNELIWGHNLFSGTGRLLVLDSAATPDGDVVLVGSFDREVSLGASTLTTASKDAFIARLDGETGQELWSVQLGDPEDTSAKTTIEATAVAIGPDGSIIVGGRFTGFTEFGFDDRSGPSPSGAGAFLLKLVGTGKRDWTALVQGEGDALVSDIDIDARGNVIAAGAFAGAISIITRGVLGAHQTSGPADSDVLLVKLSSAGTHVWSLKFGDDSAQLDGWSSGSTRIIAGPAIAVDAAGDIVLGTGVAGAVDFGGGLLGGRQDHDWAVAKLSTGGEHVWSDRFGDPAAGQGVVAIDTDPSTKAIMVTGVNDGIMDFGNGITVGEAGKLSAVVAKIDPGRIGR